MELGSRIEAWLKAKGKTRSELATFCKVTTSAVCLWIGNGKNKVPPTHKNQAKILEFLDLSWSEFWGPLPKTKKSKKAAA